MTIEVKEINLSTSVRTRLASAIWLAIRFADHFTDLILVEGSPIYVKSDQGTVELSKIKIPRADLQNFVVTEADFRNFYCGYVKELSSDDDRAAHWREHIIPMLTAMESLSDSIKTPEEEFIRFTLYQVMRGKLGMTIRVTPPPRPIHESGLPNELISKIDLGERGLVVLTGPTAAGKTSSALSLLEHFNTTSSSHIVTIEEPIEFEFTPKMCAFSQREVGRDVPSFGRGLFNALRMSPDVLLVGEVRDGPSAEMSILAGESGPLVTITTHGQTAVGALLKLLSLVGDDKQKAMRSIVARSLLGVVRQELVPCVSGGYVLVCDYLRGTSNVRSLIDAGEWDTLAALMETIRSDDHTNMNSALISHVEKGLISKSNAIRHSSNKDGLRKLLRM